MSKYTVKPVNVEGDFMWELHENASGHVVGLYYFEDDALDDAYFMERGGAFDGFTPSFMLQQVAAPRDINLEFSELLASHA